ncbi:MAG: hypothetical protein ACE5FU_12070, partial [Nitrospinota bacterium]
DDFFVFYKKNHFSMVEKINSLERMGTDEFYDIGTKLVSDIKYALEEIGSSMQDANKELLEISGRMKNIG